MKPLAVALTLVLLSTAAAVAEDEGVPAHIVDVVGDANYLNDGEEFEDGDSPTATSEPSLDILAARLLPTQPPGGGVDGFNLIVETKEPLRERDQVVVRSRTRNCADVLIHYAHNSTRRQALLSAGCTSTLFALPARVHGKELVIRVPYALLPPTVYADGTLQAVNVFTQLHVIDEPQQGRHVGLLAADTTLTATSYTMP